MARVKVYQLNGEGQWDDKGTGNVHHNVANDGCVEFPFGDCVCYTFEWGRFAAAHSRHSSLT